MSFDSKVLQAMIDKEPYKFVHPLLFVNIFPKKFNNSLEEKIEEFCNESGIELEGKSGQMIKKRIFSSIKEIIFQEIDVIYKEARNLYMQLELKKQSSFIDDKGRKLWEKFSENVKTKVIEKWQQEGFCKNVDVSKIIDYILYQGNSSVYNWLDTSKNSKISSSKKKIISEHFGYVIEVWNNIEVGNIEILKNKLESYKEKEILSKIDELFGFDDKEDKIVHDTTPEDAFSYYKKALLYRQRKEYKKALEAIEKALECDDIFVYRHYKELLHQKAILLSTDQIGDFKQALKVLKLLHYSLQYSRKEPEVVTLMGSNYKRLALIDEKGSYKVELSEDDKKNLLLAIQFYRIAYQYRDELNRRDRFYDLLNILYLEKMLAYIDNEEFSQEYFLKKYGRFTFENYAINTNDWWDVISSIEYKILLCKIKEEDIKQKVELFFEPSNSINLDYINITLRQINLYLTIVKNKNKEDCSVSLFEYLYKHLNSYFEIENGNG